MQNFTYQVGTRILFGKGQIEQLGKEILKYGRKVLLVYGGGSIKRSGIYEQVVKILSENGIEYVELSGIQPNPRVSSVRKGIELCRQHGVDFILPVGGGSTIDCAKIIAAGVMYEGDPWDFFTRKARIKGALPVGTVVTLAAAGSEMNGNAVISNEDTLEKMGTGSMHLIPKFSILDPVYTFTVPAEQTAAGIADIMSHIFEQYFSLTPGTFIQDRMAEAMLKTCIYYAPQVIANPEDYEARANIMWTGSLALNGLIGEGKQEDWATHAMEHELSAIYDITHGLGLAILTPYWMDYVLSEETAPKFGEYARNVWEIEGELDDMKLARAGIEKTAAFFRSLGLASTLKEVGVEEDRLEEMAVRVTVRGAIGGFKKLEKEDVLKIYQKAYRG